MNSVQNHIKELLFEQDCVVIPEFGGFVTKFDCAKIDGSNRFITPPQKWLAFNSLLKHDDGLLSNYIAQEEQISREQANLKIKSFVEDTKRYISFDKTYPINGLGVFSQNEESKIQFHPQTTNFHSESFGMENIFLKKSVNLQNELQIIQKPTVISDSTVQQVFATQDREPTVEIWDEEEDINVRKIRFNNALPYIYGLLAMTIFASSIYMYDNSKANLSSLNPFQLSSSMTPPIIKIIDKIQPEATLIAATTEQPKAFEDENIGIVSTKSATIIATKKRFFVITGSFGSKKNAKTLLNTLKSKGFEDASIIFPSRNEKLIKVSAAGFSTETQAQEEAHKVLQSINQETWIYKK